MIDPSPPKKISLCYVLALESTTAVSAVYCGCKDRKTWCSTCRCTCIQAGVKCSIACYEEKDNDKCPNLAAPTMQTQKRLQIRENDSQEESSKRARLNKSLENC